MPGIHHIEVWVADSGTAKAEWAWLLSRVGFTLENEWRDGQSWGSGGSYITLTTSPNLTSPTHDRRRAGINHVAFKAGSREDVDALMIDAMAHGWRALYHDRYPHAGGDDHYAGWLVNSAGFKAEVVADEI